METGNSFYKWEVIQNLGEFLTVKDLLGTATLSKEYNHILKKYVKQHYSLSNQQNQSEFRQLKQLFNRKIYVYAKDDKFAKANPSNFIARSISSQEHYSVITTLDCQFKLIKTKHLVTGKMAEPISLPQNYKLVRITEGGILYCADNYKITRFNMNNQPFTNGEVLHLKGEVEDMYCGFRYTIVVVRETPQTVKLMIFDSNQKLEGFTIVATPFEIINFQIEDHLIMGKSFSYFIFHDTLYELNIKTGAVHEHIEFVGKKIVKVIAGKTHFMAYERTQELAENWRNEEVLKFATAEGFEDYLKIFKTEKVTGKVLLGMDKKYMEEVLGIENVKLQLKIKIRMEQSNKEDPDSYTLYAWGRASEGQLGTNPSKELTKPIKLKLPNDCQVLKLSGNYTFLTNKKTKATLINSIDEKSNKLEWKEITNRKVWSLSTVEETVVMVASAGKEKVPQRQSEQIEHEKKEKLRTAKNIIDKINWDEHLKPEEFKVGYLDKYDGVLEIPFADLEKSDIKEYRIEYFKQGGQVMWDKKKRIDIL